VTDIYDLALTAKDEDRGRIALSAEISIAGEAHSPALSVELDRPTEIRIGDNTWTVIVSRYVPDDV
jgi:hypothetical protein